MGVKGVGVRFVAGKSGRAVILSPSDFGMTSEPCGSCASGNKRLVGKAFVFARGEGKLDSVV